MEVNYLTLKGNEDLRSVHTDLAAQKLPRWMVAAKDKKSTFQQFINHAIMRKVEENHNTLQINENNKFIDLADENMIYMAYKINKENLSSKPDTIDPDKYVFKYKGKYIPITTREKDFYNSYLSEEEKVYYSIKEETFYFVQPYSYPNLKLHNIESSTTYNLLKELIPHHIWNVFDEFGLMHNLKRLPYENNKSFKKRIKDKAENPANATYNGLKKHIARELGIEENQVTMHSIADDSFIGQLTNPNGTYNEKLKTVAYKIIDQLNIFWNEVTWDEGYWDVTENHEFRYIPYQIDK